MRLTDDQRQQLRATNPDATLVRTKALPEHDFAFRALRVAELDAFLMAVNSEDETEKVYAHRTLARDLLLFPTHEEWEALAAQKPAIAHAIGVELSKKAGLNAEMQVEAL